LKNQSLTMKFWHNIILMLIICVPNFKAKRSLYKKGYSKSTNTSSHEKKFTAVNFDTFPRTEFLFFSYEIFGIRPSIYWLYVWKISSPNIHTKEDIWNLTCVVVRKTFTTANFDTLPRNENLIFCHEIICHETISILITCVPKFEGKNIYKK